jgi:tetratricopeptide (TPR) repeat protein
LGYLRARRSIKLGPGVKLNLNKRSMGLTVGGRGAHYSVNTRGTRTRTIGIPGSGLSYVDRSGGRGRSRSNSRTHRPPLEASTTTPSAITHPGIFARHYDRAFYLGITKLATGDNAGALAAFQDADKSDDKHSALSPALFAGVLSFQLDDHAGAIPYLERVTNSAQALPDKLMLKYAPDHYVGIQVGHISFPVHVGSAAAALLLAECYSETDRLQEAIGLAQKLFEHEETQGMLVFLCALYALAHDWDEIVHATAGIDNGDDIGLMLRLFQAQAMEAQDLPDAALEAYRDALKSKKRDQELLKEARYNRANLYLALGKRAMAKRDLGRLYGDDPDYKDVRRLLGSLT